MWLVELKNELKHQLRAQFLLRFVVFTLDGLVEIVLAAITTTATKNPVM
jgi:hypothetical protein